MIDELARARRHARPARGSSARSAIPVLGVVGHRGRRPRRAACGCSAAPEAWSRPRRCRRRATPRRARALGRLGVRERALGARPGADARTERDRPRRAAPGRGHAALRRGDGALLPAASSRGPTPAMDAIDAASARARRWLRAALPAGLLADFLADGLVAGVGSVIVFLPQIAAPVRAALPARGRRLHGARRVRGRPRDGPRRARGARVRGAALVATRARCRASWRRARSRRRATAWSRSWSRR